jgi:uncharacterized protein YdcH (DUF465 family)
MDKSQGTSGKKYLFVFFITLGIFASAFLLSNYFSDRKLEKLRTIQDSISIDLLSSETQFSLLSELSCKDVSAATLSDELNSLAGKIEFAEGSVGGQSEVEQLKKYYSLLQIKDFLLMEQIKERCGTKIYSILYFYTNADNCTECVKQGYVLTELRRKYPDLRVYSFDYNLDLSAVNSLIAIYKVDDTELPALIINDAVMTGFKSTEDIEALLPAMVKAQEAKEAKEKAEAEAAAKAKEAEKTEE